METQELMNLGIGTKERSKLKPAKVKIVNVTIKSETNEGKVMKTSLAELNCKHPDKEELIQITKIKVERNGKLEVVSTWIQIDEEEGIKKIVKSSALALLMTYLKVNTLEELYNKEIDAVEQSKEDTYLCLKAY